jgi:hypothetical protein
MIEIHSIEEAYQLGEARAALGLPFPTNVLMTDEERVACRRGDDEEARKQR